MQNTEDQTSARRPTIGKVAAVILAAGRSSRMGHPKQLAVVDGEPMLVRATRVALASRADQVLVISGAYAAAVHQLLANSFSTEAALRWRIVHNPDWATGQASSVHAAIKALSAFDQLSEIGAVLFLPVDQPYLTSDFLDQLIEHWQRGAALAAPIVNGEYRGAPAIFDRSQWAALLAIRGDVGGRPVLMAQRANVDWLPAPAELLRDIDTPEDMHGGAAGDLGF